VAVRRSTAIAISMLGPSYLADGIAAVTLICMHLTVGAILVWGLAHAQRSPAGSLHARPGR
jgi:hypothetical protein